jgi:elongation factor P--beta-lysine ligase
MFANFYDEAKTREENQKEFEKARHNKEVTAHYVTAFAVVAGAVGAVLGVKKLIDEFT